MQYSLFSAGLQELQDTTAITWNLQGIYVKLSSTQANWNKRDTLCLFTDYNIVQYCCGFSACRSLSREIGSMPSLPCSNTNIPYISIMPMI